MTIDDMVRPFKVSWTHLTFAGAGLVVVLVVGVQKLETHKQSIQGSDELRGCDAPMFFSDFHYASFPSNSFSIGP